jgi:phage portal protein BeeE
MGIFSRKVETAAFASAPVQAAAGASNINNFLTYLTGTAETRALSIPTVSRSRDLLAGIIGSTGLKHYSKQWNGEDYDEVYLPLEPWMERPDPKVSRSFFFVNIMSDMMMHGIAYAYIQTRYSTGLPASFTWLPAANMSSTEQSGFPQFYGPSDELEFNGQPLDVNNVVQFISPIAGILKIGARAINTSLFLDAAADRYAALETVPGYLQQIDGEDMSGDDLGSLASAWAAARKQNAIGALSRQVQFKEFAHSPQEVIGEQRKYQSLEMARLCSVPAYMVSAPQEGASMTYQNAQQARQDLYLFGARIYMDAIEQTLSSSQVLPRNRYVEFDIEDYVGSEDRSPDGMPDNETDEEL